MIQRGWRENGLFFCSLMQAALLKDAKDIVIVVFPIMASPLSQLIPTCIDHDPRAHLRRPIVMMRHG